MTSRLLRLSRTVSHALRHAPEEYGITLDQNGWIEISQLLASLADKKTKWQNLTEGDIYAMAAAGEKQRFEFDNGRIRAIYGHSLAETVEHEPVQPPDRLFHGTTPEAFAKIKREGLVPVSRQYVHLSPDTETAAAVARRRTSDPVILTINALRAFSDGVPFYRGNDKVWLAKVIAPVYILATDRESG